MASLLLFKWRVVWRVVWETDNKVSPRCEPDQRRQRRGLPGHLRADQGQVRELQQRRQRPGVRKVLGWPMYSCGNTARKGCSWPNFWANLASFSLDIARHLRVAEAQVLQLHQRRQALHVPADLRVDYPGQKPALFGV